MASCCIIWTVNTFFKYLLIIWSNFSEIFWQFYVKYKNYEIYQKKIDLTLLTVNKVHIKKYSGGASIHKINEAIFSCFRIYFTGIHLCIQQTKHLQCSFLNPNYFFFSNMSANYSNTYKFKKHSVSKKCTDLSWLKNLSKWSQSLCKFSTFNLQFQKFFWVDGTIFSHNRSDQF